MLPRRDLQHDSHLPENVPSSLKARPCWMGTRLEELPNGKWSKPPYRVRVGRPVVKADKTKTENHASFEEACEALSSGAVDAIGFVSTETDPFTFKDLDGVVDPETGEIDLRASEIVENFPTYWETSISGRGLHGICIAKKPGTRCRTGKIEIYDGHSGARFMVITGNQFGPIREIRPCQEQVEALYGELFPEREKPPGRPFDHPHNLEQNELLERARKSKTGAHFRKLFDRGDTSGYKSASDADFALINTLIFWCAGNGDAVEELFKASALHRPPPEKHKNYVGISIRNALASYQGSYYQPKVLREKSTQEQGDILTPYLALLLDASQWKGQTGAAAYKAYAALILLVVENGIKPDADELQIGVDIRRLAERAGVRRQTLQRSALPFLWHKDRRLIKWQREERKRGGRFILPRPDCVVSRPSKESTRKYFTGSRYGTGLDALGKLIRMRTGSATTGKSKSLGEMQKVARLGMVAMFCMVTLTATQRGLKMSELVERTGRQRRYVRNAIDKLKETKIVAEPRKDYFALADGFWSEYDKDLHKTGIVASERWQKKQHKKEREEEERRRNERRDKERIKADPKVKEMPTDRLRQIDQDTKLHHPTDARLQVEPQKRSRYKPIWEDRGWLKPEEQVLVDDYDHMCARVGERLARSQGEGAS